MYMQATIVGVIIRLLELNTDRKGVSMSMERECTSNESKALFSVMGMTCSACSASVEKAVKRLPGIREAIVDVLNNKAQVIFYPSFVKVSSFSISLHLSIFATCYFISILHMFFFLSVVDVM